MDERHERSLIERWPEWFDVNGDVRRTLMRFGFQHGNGWYGLVYGLCEPLEAAGGRAERQNQATRIAVLPPLLA